MKDEESWKVDGNLSNKVGGAAARRYTKNGSAARPAMFFPLATLQPKCDRKKATASKWECGLGSVPVVMY
jgi:hypothetical protein